MLAATLAFAATPVGAQSDDGFRFSGAQRARFERLDPQFRAGLGENDRALALQTSVSFDWHRGAFEARGEIMDSRTEWNDSDSFVSITVANALEPVQAYVAWHGAASTIRIGRLTLDLGKRRLLARSLYRNTLSTFAGVDWTWRGDSGNAARVFVSQPMRILPNDRTSLLDDDHELDRGWRGSTLAGVYYQLAPFDDRSTLELYALSYKAQTPISLAAEHRSYGLRAYRPPAANRVSYEIEAVLQRGHSAGLVGGTLREELGHAADFLHAEIGYTFDRPLAPTISLQYDRASGDKNPTDDRNERFNTLFGARRFDFGPTGIYGLAFRSNLETPGVRLTLNPAERWQTMFAYRSFRLAAARDVWVGSGYADPTGAAGKSIGRQLEGDFSVEILPNRLSIEAGAAYDRAGRFARTTAAADFLGNPRYFYAAVTTRF